MRDMRRVLSMPRFNPLHCGAVVASYTLYTLVASPPQSFNPLHCGAVVASCSHHFQSRCRRFVSIPFIAGQWSLPSWFPEIPPALLVFQSPSLRGSGRFTVVVSCFGRYLVSFQSPSLRGSGRFVSVLPNPAASVVSFNPLHCGAVVASSLETSSRIVRVVVSIPFIAGQWSLPPRTTPLSFCRVLLRNTRPACDHVLCARLHVWPKPVIIP